METRTAPAFTTAIRGYDREEVDEYVDSLAKALEDLEQSEEHSRRLQAHLTRLSARVHELEARIRTESPRTVAALGERITLVLTEAEAGATETLERAEVEAASIVSDAEARAAVMLGAAEAREAVADERIRCATERAETLARAIEEQARQRATARTKQVEEWEDQVVTHMHTEQARQARKLEETEARHRVQMAELDGERDRALAGLTEVRDALTQLLDRPEPARAPQARTALGAPVESQVDADDPAESVERAEPAGPARVALADFALPDEDESDEDDTATTFEAIN